MEYLPRVVDQQLLSRLASTGAVLIEGPKACGKTVTARQAAKSEVLLDTDPAAQQALAVDPGLVLQGATPRLVDEWQVGGSQLWNQVRRQVDDRQGKGQFILTGSSTPRDDVARHSGAGRISRLRMRPMSLFELGHSTNEVPLAGLFEGEMPTCADPGLSVLDIIDQIAVGGWPQHIGLSVDEALQANIDYLENAREVDVRTVTGSSRAPRRLGRLLESLARNTAAEVKVSALARETAGGEDGTPAARTTIYEYLDALERLMLTEDVAAWGPHLRSKARLRKEPKRHFVDPSLAVAALRTTPRRLLSDLNYTGFLFESLVVRDLRILSQPLGGEVSHYRDSNQVEADVVLQLPDGRWGAIEVKLGPERVEEAASSLRRFVGDVDVARSGRPSFLAVVTNGSYGYRRPDGVMVVPVGALQP